MRSEYQRLHKRLREQTKHTRDRDIRIKVELILLAHKLGSVSEACSRRGFSRGFYYKWYGKLRRNKWNIQALKERSRKPKNSPKKTSSYWELKIFKLHEQGYGARMIEAMLKRQGHPIHRTTICHILNHRKKYLRRSRRQKLKAHRRRYELPIPGQRIQIDVKYVPERVDGERVYTYVAIDECTRWRYTRAYYELNPASTVDFLFRLQEEAPFPLHTLQTDNGFEFTYKLTPHSHVTHPMDEWCHRYGIKHRLIPPGEKELNGKVERSHRIDEQYFYWQAPTDDIINFNEKLTEWIKIYNEERLHMGIGYKTPKEKLLERWETLRRKKEIYPEYEFHILRFIKEMPNRLYKRGKQLKDQILVA